MTEQVISPLRRRMIEDMTIRKLAPKTQEDYIRTISKLAVFLGRSPDTASPEDIRRFQLHLAANGTRSPINERSALCHSKTFTRLITQRLLSVLFLPHVTL